MDFEINKLDNAKLAAALWFAKQGNKKPGAVRIIPRCFYAIRVWAGVKIKIPPMVSGGIEIGM